LAPRRFVLTPVGSSGDVHPFVGLGRALRARGHEVIVVTGEPFGALVLQAGLGFHATHSAEEFDRISKDPDLWHPRRGLRVILSPIAAALQLGYERIKEVYEPGRTVLVGHALSFSTRNFEEKHGAPAATVHLAPSIFRSDYQQPAIAPGIHLSGAPRWLKRGFWWTFDRMLIDPLIVPALNQFRYRLGLPPVTRVMREWIHSPRRVIGLFPDWFGPPQPDWPAALRLTGFPLYDEADQQQISPALRRFFDQGAPPIIFTPGSAHQAAGAFFRTAVEACARLGRRGLLLTRYPEQLPELPHVVHHEPYVPLSLVLPRCAALVHHGGIGTSAQGLAAGVPQLTMPMGFDQPDNAMRLFRLGVGRSVRPARFQGKTVAAALQGLLENPRVAVTCAHWSRHLTSNPAIDRTCDLLEELG
jgi:rhamnosyltransferase subunit B